MQILFPCLLLAVACGTDTGNARNRPDHGGSGDGGTGVAAAAPTYEPTFSAIHTEVLVGKRCILGLCHGEGAAGGGLDLYPKADAYRNLVGVPASSSGCRDTGLVRVEPGAPEQSLFFSKLSAEPPCGVSMPPDELVDVRHVYQVAEWILRGAPDD